MPAETRKKSTLFKSQDYRNVVDEMKKRKEFDAGMVAEISKKLNIPRPRVDRYKKKYLKEGGVEVLDKEVQPPTAVIVESKIVGKFANMDMKTIDEELEKLTHFKWDGMNFLLHCINEFKVVVSNPETKLDEKIKLFKLIAPYIAAMAPQTTESTGQGNGLTVANIYNQAQQFYQQQNFIPDETNQDSSKGNKQK